MARTEFMFQPWDAKFTTGADVCRYDPAMDQSGVRIHLSPRDDRRRDIAANRLLSGRPAGRA
jgi:hypothetical protein